MLRSADSNVKAAAGMTLHTFRKHEGPQNMLGRVWERKRFKAKFWGGGSLRV